ncbi:uncharacterized protein B0H64DRAFT_412451 [Chaetomium fimeti]|uniref:DUF7587 domain-containing protein n=1 Tax=Chaetomium fimeti TaxID=1854472 RepID=A0AAE0LMB0_9PEZI|nr:hypothetical protein B0H64DRAFT_412451 [Chaetomium fimeti]
MMGSRPARSPASTSQSNRKMSREIYTRVYSPRSAGQLTSGRGPTGPSLSQNDLLVEFTKHADLWNRTPTALVSVSNRIVDTVQRACQKYKSGESPANTIWVVFIEVPAARRRTPTVTRLHPARDLAKQCLRRWGQELSHLLEPPVKFDHEFLFEWGIPDDHVLHRVSLQTLMDRGLDVKASSTADFQDSMARQFFGGDTFDIGVSLGGFARPFGARAPLEWIVARLYYDCVRTETVDWSPYMIMLKYDKDGHHYKMVEISFFRELDDAVGTVLMDWWLGDSSFADDYREFERWRNAMEKNNNVLREGLSAKQRQEIEGRAVSIGL